MRDFRKEKFKRLAAKVFGGLFKVTWIFKKVYLHIKALDHEIGGLEIFFKYFE